mmetsp:Transcript_12494/g.37842  ORF Transcript_12494/g.37842 Transcript_12494/m.37842 type:complete len:238 (+) Transcript_12494:1690-2403(+)
MGKALIKRIRENLNDFQFESIRTLKELANTAAHTWIRTGFFGYVILGQYPEIVSLLLQVIQEQFLELLLVALQALVGPGHQLAYLLGDQFLGHQSTHTSLFGTLLAGLQFGMDCEGDQSRKQQMLSFEHLKEGIRELKYHRFSTFAKRDTQLAQKEGMFLLGITVMSTRSKCLLKIKGEHTWGGIFEHLGLELAQVEAKTLLDLIITVSHVSVEQDEYCTAVLHLASKKLYVRDVFT